jgi:transposase
MDSDKPGREKMIVMYSKVLPRIPRETARAATAVFGRGNFYILLGNHLEGILEDLERQNSLKAEHPSRPDDVHLPLITFFQFVEGLTDIQAMDAVRTRTDWKFALHLPLIPARLHADALCQFRQKIVRDPVRQWELQRLIDRLVVFAPMLSKARTLKSLEVVSIVCSLNRLHHSQQSMSQALEVLAVQFPQWLRKIALPHWYGRYNPTVLRLDGAILLEQQRILMDAIASDIHHLLEKVHQTGSQEMNELHEIQVLDRIMPQQIPGLTREGEKQLETLRSKDCDLCFQNEAGRRLRT